MTEADQTQDSTAGLGDGFQPGPVLLIGPPGVGKGTQAKLLMGDFCVPQISTGDLFRAHRSEGTTLGSLADTLMKRGELVPDDLVNQMVADRLAQSDCVNGYILDGFPRTLAQANWLDSYLATRVGALPVIVLSLVVSREDLLRRITGRRICPAGHIYNIYTQAPRVVGVCDVDGLLLQQRSDDSEAVFESRMRVFDEETAPVIPHYRAQGRFVEIDGLGEVDEVAKAIRTALTQIRLSTPATMLSPAGKVR